MAVFKNPYKEWQNLRNTSDYRSTDTQVTSIVRQQLSQSEYLRSSNRVNPGPNRNLRVKIAENSAQIPHVFGSEDMWGWQIWSSRKYQSNLASVVIAPGLLLEGLLEQVPGVSYHPYNSVGGASYSEFYYFYSQNSTYSSQDLDLSLEGDPIISPLPPSGSTNNIFGIPINIDALDTNSFNYVMIYNPSSNSFSFTSPSRLIGLADNDGDPDNMDFGGY